VFDVVGHRRWFFAFSLLITIPGLIFIILTPLTGGTVGLQFSIDYTGGTQWIFRFEDESVTAADVQGYLDGQGIDSQVRPAREGFIEVLSPGAEIPPPAPEPTPVPTLAPSASPDASASPAASESPSPSPSESAAAGASPAPSASPSPGTGVPTQGRLGEIATGLQDEFGPIAEQASLTSIGPVVSSELIQQALILILVGSLGILLWITFRFADFRFGTSALIALLHDVLVVLGFFAIFGTLVGLKIDALFVTAMLTVIGFSVHDTIVVFDRVRENRARHAGEPFSAIVNHSIYQTFGRSLSTSFTVLITLLALLLFTGGAIQSFMLALIIGVVSGTYSSIFNASLILAVWEDTDARRKGRQVARVSRRATS
jgi:preprotein translocase SecF subunit